MTKSRVGRVVAAMLMTATAVVLPLGSASADGQCRYATRTDSHHEYFGQGSDATFKLSTHYNQCGNHAHVRWYRVTTPNWSYRIRSAYVSCNARDARGRLGERIGSIHDGRRSMTGTYNSRRMYYSNSPRQYCTVKIDAVAAKDDFFTLTTRIGRP
jgi:hypothetical protein